MLTGVLQLTIRYISEEGFWLALSSLSCRWSLFLSFWSFDFSFLNFDIDWDKLPDDFAEYYLAYNHLFSHYFEEVEKGMPLDITWESALLVKPETYATPLASHLVSLFESASSGYEGKA